MLSGRSKTAVHHKSPVKGRQKIGKLHIFQLFTGGYFSIYFGLAGASGAHTGEGGFWLQPRSRFLGTKWLVSMNLYE